MIAENKLAIAFLDVDPISDGHTIIIPKRHVRDLSSCDTKTLNAVIELAHKVSNLLKDSYLQPWGFNYLSNEGNIAGQIVMHFHIHIIPKYGKNEGFKLSIGHKYVDKVENVYKKLIK